MELTAVPPDDDLCAATVLFRKSK